MVYGKKGGGLLIHVCLYVWLSPLFSSKIAALPKNKFDTQSPKLWSGKEVCHHLDWTHTERLTVALCLLSDVWSRNEKHQTQSASCLHGRIPVGWRRRTNAYEKYGPGVWRAIDHWSVISSSWSHVSVMERGGSSSSSTASYFSSLTAQLRGREGRKRGRRGGRGGEEGRMNKQASPSDYYLRPSIHRWAAASLWRSEWCSRSL